jgi:hypothetical protein
MGDEPSLTSIPLPTAASTTSSLAIVPTNSTLALQLPSGEAEMIEAPNKEKSFMEGTITGKHEVSPEGDCDSKVDDKNVAAQQCGSNPRLQQQSVMRNPKRL